MVFFQSVSTKESPAMAANPKAVQWTAAKVECRMHKIIFQEIFIELSHRF